MALIKCPECGKIFSDRAAHCPQCGLPTCDALELITTGAPAPEAGAPLPSSPNDEEAESVPAPTAWDGAGGGYNGGVRIEFPPRYKQPEPKKQRNLLTYILIVAVILLAVVCIALVVTTSGVLNAPAAESADTVAAMQSLPPDTTPARVEAEPQAKPIAHPILPEEIPAESEEIEIEASEAAQPTAAQPAAESAPTPAVQEQSAPVAEE